MLFARFVVKKWKSGLKRRAIDVPMKPRSDQDKGWEAINIRATAPDGTAVLLTVRNVFDKQNLAEVTVYVKLPNGTSYQLPRKYDVYYLNVFFS